MNWNHRLVKKDTEWGPEFSIKEFYYNSEDEIIGWTENDATPWGVDIDEVKQTLQWMIEACNKPVILQSDLDDILEQLTLRPKLLQIRENAELDSMISNWEGE